MSPLDTVLLEVFTGIVAISLLIQSLALFGMYRSIKVMAARIEGMSVKLAENINVLSGNLESLLGTLRGIADGVRSLQDNLTSASAIVKKRVEELDAFVEEITNSARLQMARVQDVVDTASRRVEATLDVLQDSVLTPVTEVNAIIRGVKAAIDVLTRKRRRPSSSVSQDEEMFI